MAKQIKIIKNGEITLFTLEDDKTLILVAEPNTEYQILDDNGQIAQNVQFVIKSPDLEVYLDKKTPHIILEKYTSYYPYSESAFSSHSSLALTKSQDIAASQISNHLLKYSFIGMGVLGLPLALLASRKGKSSSSSSENNNSEPNITNESTDSKKHTEESVNKAENQTVIPTETIPTQPVPEEQSKSETDNKAKNEPVVVPTEPAPEESVPTETDTTPKNNQPEAENTEAENNKPEPSTPEEPVIPEEESKSETDNKAENEPVVPTEPAPEESVPSEMDTTPESNQPEEENAEAENSKLEPSTTEEPITPEEESKSETDNKAENEPVVPTEPAPEESAPTETDIPPENNQPEEENNKVEPSTTEEPTVVPEEESKSETDNKTENEPVAPIEPTPEESEPSETDTTPESNQPEEENAEAENSKLEPSTTEEPITPEEESKSETDNKAENEPVVPAEPAPEESAPTETDATPESNQPEEETTNKPENELASVAITQINDNQAVNLGQQFAKINGVLELPKHLLKYHNHELIYRVDVKIGDRTYNANIDHKTLSFSLSIDKEELSQLQGEPISYEFITARFARTPEIRYGKFKMEQNINQKIALTNDNVILTSDVITDLGNRHYKISHNIDNKVSVEGKAEGSTKAGDEITLIIGDNQLVTTLKDDRTFSAKVDLNWLKSTDQIKVQLASASSQGKDILAESTADYAMATQNSNNFVSGNTALPEEKLIYLIRNLDYYNSRMKKFLQFPDTDRVMPYSFSPVFNEEQKASVVKALDILSKYTKIKFEENPMAEFKLYFDAGSIEDNVRAYASHARNSVTLSDFIHKHLDSQLSFRVIWHEIEHLLGATHPHEKTSRYKIDSSEDYYAFSVMSYHLEHATQVPDYDIRPVDLMFLHYYYGVNKAARAGNDVYSFQPFSMSTADGGTYIWDGDGIDTFDASNEKQGVTVNLTPGSWIYSGQKADRFFVEKHIIRDSAEDFGVARHLDYTGTPQIAFEFTQGQAFIGFGTQIENLIGSDYDDILTGNKADNIIYGGDGNDVIDGGEGNDFIDGGRGGDTMLGGLGNDIFVVNDIGDKVQEKLNEGTDTVYSYIDYQLPDNTENLFLQGNAIRGIGNQLDNYLKGNQLDNVLIGGEGNDYLNGAGGNDILTGGAGQDRFVFDSGLDGSIDQITDFNPDEDKILLLKEVFTHLTDGVSVMNYIKYDKDSGILAYASDTNANPIAFAQISKHLALDQTHFELV